MIRIDAFKITQKIDHKLFNHLSQFVDKERQLKLKKFHFWEDAVRSLLAELLIRYVIIEKTKLKNKNISFIKNKYGKLYLKNRKKFHFNISHTGDWIVCAFDHKPIGIDIERIRSINLEFCQHYFAQDECSELYGQDDPLSYFFTLWTLKESYIKAIGRGLSCPLNSFSIKFRNSKDIVLISQGKVIQEIFFKQYTIDTSYKMAVCAFNNTFPEYPRIHSDIKEICKHFQLVQLGF